MSRDASGLYTLPAGNPVVTGTTITTTWANATLTDIADTLSDSLSRSGKGPMTAVLRGVDGNIGAPGFAFASETSLGIYRAAASVLGVSNTLRVPRGVVGTPIFQFEDATSGLFREAGTTTIAMSLGGEALYRFASGQMSIRCSGALSGGGVAALDLASDFNFFSITRSTGAAFQISAGSGSTNIGTSATGGFLWFYTNGTGNERMRLDTSGSLLVGTGSSTNAARITAASLAFNPGAADGWKKGSFQGNGAFGGGISMVNNGGASDGFAMFLSGIPSALTIQFGANGGVVSNGVTLASTATAWASASDERLKVLGDPIVNAREKLATLRTTIGRYKKDNPSMRRAFLIAQDVQAVLPEAVDVMDDEGHLSLRYTELIPLIIAAINEIRA